MRFVKSGVIAFFVCSMASASNLRKPLIAHNPRSENRKNVARAEKSFTTSKSYFPDMEGRARDLIAQIYAQLIPSRLQDRDTLPINPPFIAHGQHVLSAPDSLFSRGSKK